MATENVDGIYPHEFAQGIPLDGVGKSFGEYVTCLVVGSDVADVKPLGSTNFSKPMQIYPVRAS